MAKIVFFSIPAHGHTNPTIEVVHKLTQRNHEVRYYSFDEFKKRIEEAGAAFISCDQFLPPPPKNLEKKVGKDFASLIEMAVDTTFSLEKFVCTSLNEWKPEVIVSDSICFWGKLFAKKLQVPYICSTTTFAFNQYSARMMKPGIGEMLCMFTGMPRIQAKMKLLAEHGYPVSSFIDIVQNDNETDTIVFTAKEFQPFAETFSDKFTFVGPSVAAARQEWEKKQRQLVYISLGTVLNKNKRFYLNCIKGLAKCGLDVIMSVGDKVDIESLGALPENILVYDRVNQLEVLKKADVFLTHCGMNSVNESIFSGVPMVLFPQHSEEGAVAGQAEKLGMGIWLHSISPGRIKEAIFQVIENDEYRKRTEKFQEIFREAGGAEKAADKIESVLRR